jgi:uncharacterized protein YbaR (Trm112 family)/SAM-dependent methyltransferase
MKKILFKILACPDCKNRLNYIEKDRQFECSLCKVKFNFSNEVPVLFSKNSNSIENSGVSFYQKKDLPARSNWTRKFAMGISRLSNLSVGETLHDKLRNKYIFDLHRDSLILNLGSGIDNIIMRNNVINFDIFPHPNTDVSGDGHYLPFLPGSFDGVWVCAVLEHLENPFQVSSEIYRILKPGGFVLVSAPFMFPLHGSPHDYFRYTASGLRSVFGKFKEVECGTTHTLPTGTIIEIFSQYWSIYFDNKMISAGIRLVVKLLFSPLKLLDYYLKKKSKEQILAGGYVFLGKKE